MKWSWLILLFLPLTGVSKSLLTTKLESQFWHNSPAAKFGQASDAKIAANSDTSWHSQLSLSFEHPFPLLPNISLSRTNIENESTKTIEQTFLLNNRHFAVASTLHANVRVQQNDYVVFYEVFDNHTLELDTGVNFKQHQVTAQVIESKTSYTAIAKAEHLKPALYAAGRVNLPLLGYSFYGKANIDEKENYDYDVGFGYQVPMLTFAKTEILFGYKRQSMSYSSSNLVADIKFDSIYTGFSLQL